MKTYTITKVSGQPDWEAIPALEMDVSYRKKLEDIPIRAWTQVAYNEDALLIRQRALEPVLRTELTGLTDEVCEDSCLELFFCPVEGDLRYFNIEYTPICNRFLGFGSGIPDLVRLLPDENNDRFDPVVTTFEGGWELTYQIPYEFIRRFFPNFAPETGKTMRVNCSKCGNKTVTPHWLTWNPLPYSDTHFTFHNPSEYGQMIFG
ncbi:MAG: carbohydrate-binding family 9-like protein [Oscillospiraceae bacterium]|nr:carbohydrate-binding family 9-like protein [Oscillospiraceae bacterium]